MLKKGKNAYILEAWNCWHILYPVSIIGHSPRRHPPKSNMQSVSQMSPTPAPELHFHIITCKLACESYAGSLKPLYSKCLWLRNYIRWMFIIFHWLLCKQVVHCLCSNESYQVLVLFRHQTCCRWGRALNCMCIQLIGCRNGGSVAHARIQLCDNHFCGNRVIKSEDCVAASLAPPMWALTREAGRLAGREDQGVSSNKPEEIMLPCC